MQLIFGFNQPNDEKNQHQNCDKKCDWKVTSDSLVPVFFGQNWNGRNTSAIYCWKNELAYNTLPYYLRFHKF